MARPLRVQFPGAFYHVMARGQERQDIFRGADDFARFLDDLEAVREKHRVRVHAYCLMTNHYHLMVETCLPNLAKALQNLQTRYTVWFNRKHQRVGHLFSGRYKAILVEKETYGLELSRYIHLNPVRAGLCDRPETYPYSSYRFYTAQKIPEGIPLDSNWTLGQFHPDESRGRAAYRAFVSAAVAIGGGRDISTDVRSQLVLGGESFLESVKGRVRRSHPESARNPLDVPTARELRSRPIVPLDAVVRVVCRVCGVSREEVREGRHAKPARPIALLLAAKHGGRTYQEIGDYFGGVQYSAVAQSICRLEARLEKDDALSRIIESCERRLHV